jgi:hypothetical protein
VLRGLTWKHCLVYVDDVIIWSKDFESHLQHLDLVFQRLRMANLTLRPNKCEFAKPEILYLGHFISREGPDNNIIDINQTMFPGESS